MYDYLRNPKFRKIYIVFVYASMPLIIFNIKKIDNYFTMRIEFDGEIIRKRIDNHNHDPHIIISKNKKEEDYDIINMSIYKIIDSGDYISKKKGTVNYLLIKKRDTIIFQQ